MGKSLPLLLLFLIAQSEFALADQAQIAKPQLMNCFENKMPFFQTINKMTGSQNQKLNSLITACAEFAEYPEMSKGLSLAEKAATIPRGYVFFIAGQGLSNFSKMNHTVKQREFMQELEKIKKNPNPMDRVSLTYDLVAKTQGKYDYKTEGGATAVNGLFFTWLTPENIVNTAESQGSGGVCREFASLLTWSLKQVERYPGSNSANMGPHDFTAEFKSGTVPGYGPGDSAWKHGDGDHAWVRIKLPQKNTGGDSSSLNEFDLDSAWYPNFSPLFPRRSGLSAKSQLEFKKQCQLVLDCLANNSLVSAGAGQRPQTPQQPMQNNGAH